LNGPSIVGGQALSNFGLGRTNQQLGYGGLLLSAGSDSVNVLLRALAANRRIQILSRPQIRALDSLEATVFVGQNIPTVTNFTTNATTGVISPQLQPVQTGIGMTVTPRINIEGNVVIQMYAYRSQLSTETVTVTTDSRGQPVGQRITDISSVRTTVLVPNNHTIVIGGMIASRDDASTRKAPFIGDIPVLGSLFRYDSRTSVRSELLIFLTPRVIDGQHGEEALKEIEMSRLHFIECEAEEAHGPLRALPAPDDVFDGSAQPWIKSSDPPATTPLPPLPSQPIPTLRDKAQPPPPPPSEPTDIDQPDNQISPPPPELPEADAKRIRASRLRATEDDTSEMDKRVTPVNFLSPKRKKPAKPVTQSAYRELKIDEK
jgi:hypothetical protein